MPAYNFVFYAISFFLIGVFLAGSGLGLGFILFFVLFAMAVFLFIKILALKNVKIIWLALISFTVFGAFYFNVFGNFQKQSINIIYDRKITFCGKVGQIKERAKNQKLIVNLQYPFSGKISVNLKPYPSYEYGDFIKFSGVILKPAGQTNPDLAGTSVFPQNELLPSGRQVEIKELLAGLKNKIISGLRRALPHEKAAYLSGVILGDTTEFSKELKTAMANSGTTHIVALSGYNITILVEVVFGFLIWFLNRKTSFFITIFAIIGFVLMAGAQSSVVRAAIMGGILLLARQTGRIYSVRNALAVSAFAMVLFDPKILRFDIGFQLSFLALMGLVYVQPAIEKFFRINKESDFFKIKENFFTTLSAQLAVFPLLISSFGTFSVFSIITNILVLSFIPLTMALGFILGILGFISYHLSLIFSWLVYPFLAYELSIIKIFGQMGTVKPGHLGPVFTIIYYFTLTSFVLYNSDIKKKLSRKLRQYDRSNALEQK